MDKTEAAKFLGQIGRSRMTEAQRDASRRNGKLGGRPKGSKSVIVRTRQPERSGLE